MVKIEKVPSVWAYSKNNSGWIKGGKIGREYRRGFTEKAVNESTTPGPGKYKMPTEFGNYKKINSFL